MLEKSSKMGQGLYNCYVQLLTAMHEFVLHRSPPHLKAPLHPLKAGDWVLLKVWKRAITWAAAWRKMEGILRHSSLKLDGVKLWVHHTRARKLPETDQPSLPTASEQTPEKQAFHPLRNFKYLFQQAEWKFCFLILSHTLFIHWFFR